MKSYKSKTGRLLDEFKRKGELYTRDLYKYGTGCSSRLYELRKEDHVIVSFHVKGPRWKYVYMGQRDDRGILIPSSYITTNLGGTSNGTNL